MSVASQSNNKEAQAPSLNVQYGHAWMITTMKEHQELDHAQLHPHAKLEAYLESPLELMDDIVRWWGVCFSFYILSAWFSNNFNRNIKSNIQPFCEWLKTTLPSKDQLPLPSMCSLVVVLQAPNIVITLMEWFSKVCSFSRVHIAMAMS
jgi:hypothetical protein